MIQKLKRNPWPYAIIAYFVVFISAMAGWVSFAVRNDMELVGPNYYEQEIRFQDQIDRVARTAPIRNDVRIQYRPEEGSITVALPKAHTGRATRAELKLYRPSDSRMDRIIPLASDAATQKINVADLPIGFWKLHLSWTMDGAEYFFAQPLVIAPR